MELVVAAFGGIGFSEHLDHGGARGGGCWLALLARLGAVVAVMAVVAFRDYYISYCYAGSNNDGTNNFFPFPFTGLGVTYDPYYQAQLEAASTEDELALIQPKLIGTSEFIYAIPKNGHSDDAKNVSL